MPISGTMRRMRYRVACADMRAWPGTVYGIMRAHKWDGAYAVTRGHHIRRTHTHLDRPPRWDNNGYHARAACPFQTRLGALRSYPPTTCTHTRVSAPVMVLVVFLC